MLTGQCLCGAVHYRVSEAPVLMYHCHCSQCRHASGASFATNVLVKQESLEITQGEDAIARFESSPGKLRHFCSHCGSPLFSVDPGLTQFRSIRAGTLDGDPGLRPSRHFWTGSVAPWTELDDALEKDRQGPGSG